MLPQASISITPIVSSPTWPDVAWSRRSIAASIAFVARRTPNIPPTNMTMKMRPADFVIPAGIDVNSATTPAARAGVSVPFGAVRANNAAPPATFGRD